MGGNRCSHSLLFFLVTKFVTFFLVHFFLLIFVTCRIIIFTWPHFAFIIKCSHTAVQQWCHDKKETALQKSEIIGKYDETIEANKFSSICPQKAEEVLPRPNDVEVSEDCLTLNIYAPNVRQHFCLAFIFLFFETNFIVRHFLLLCSVQFVWNMFAIKAQFRQVTKSLNTRLWYTSTVELLRQVKLKCGCITESSAT